MLDSVQEGSKKGNPQTHLSEIEFKEIGQYNFQVQDIVYSQVIEAYEKQFTNIQVPSFKEIQEKILKSGKFQLKQTYASTITENFIKTDFESMSLQLHYGQYATKIDTINLKLKCNFAKQIILGKGQFGTVYSCDYEKLGIAIKAIKITDSLQNNFNSIKKVYKQYFIALLASELGVGPKILNVFGYDILFINTQAFFSMQRCYFQPPNQFDALKLSEKSQSLKTSLKVLHSAKIVHRDIKPSNICWSHTHQKYVFIDFGLSTLIEQGIGQKTYCSFVGTYAYSSDEMKGIYILRTPGYADLYFNDLVGLRKSITNMDRQEAIRRADNFEVFQTKNSLFSNFVEILDIKRDFFHNKNEAVVQKVKKLGNMYESCIQILNKGIQITLVSKQERQQWQETLHEMHNRVISQKYQASRADQILSGYFQQQGTDNLINRLIPLEEFLENKFLNFSEILKDKEWIDRFYRIVNPFVQGYLNQKDKPELAKNAIYIINKIYKHLQGTDSNLFIKKLRRVILYFYTKFEELKNINYLTGLSEMLTMMQDQYNILKIRKSILKIIKEPFQYSFTCLYFFVVSQNTNYFNIPNIQMGYIQNILEMKTQDREKIGKEKEEEFNLVLLIAKQFQMFKGLKYPMSSLEDLFRIFNTIYKLMLSLESILKQSRILIELHDILKLFIQIFCNFLQKSKQNDFTTLDNEPIQAIISRLLQKRRLILNQEDKAFVKFVSVCSLRPLISSLQFITSLSVIEQIYQFFFQIYQGRAKEMNYKFVSVMLSNLHRNIKTLPIILKIKTAWMVKNREEPMNFNSFYLQLKFMLSLATHIYFKRNQQNIEELLKYQAEMDEIVRFIQSRAEKQVMETSSRQIIFHLIRIIDNIKIFLQKNDIKSIQLISQISATLQSSAIRQQQFLELTMNRIGFLQILAWVRRNNLIQSKFSRAKLDDEILILWKATNFPIGAITSDYLLEELVDISHSRQKYMDAYELLNRIIEIINLNIKIYQRDMSIKPLRAAFHRFSNKTPTKVLEKIITHFLNSPQLPNQIKKKQMVLFLSLMLKNCFEMVEQKPRTKLLQLIAQNINTMDQFGQALVKQQYWGMFRKLNQTNRRKTLIMQRRINRSTLQDTSKKHLLLIKLVKDLSVHMKPWIRSYLKDRVNKLKG